METPANKEDESPSPTTEDNPSPSAAGAAEPSPNIESERDNPHHGLEQPTYGVAGMVPSSRLSALTNPASSPPLPQVTLSPDQTVSTPSQSMSLAGPSKKERLRAIFRRYGEFREETGSPAMKRGHYLRLLQDSGLLDGRALAKSEAEVTFAASAGKKGMDFDSFFRSLVRVAETRYTFEFRKDKAHALELVLTLHLLPLYDHGQGRESARSSQQRPEDLIYDPETKELMNSVYPVIKNVYEAYFVSQLRCARDIRQRDQISAKQLIIFSLEFGLIKSGFLSQKSAIAIMDTLLATEETSLTNNPKDRAVFSSSGNGETATDSTMTGFNLERFWMFLFWTAVLGFDSARPDAASEYSQAGIHVQCIHFFSIEKVYFLLGQMQLSQGFEDLGKRYFKHCASPRSLMPPSDVIGRLVVNNPLVACESKLTSIRLAAKSGRTGSKSEADEESKEEQLEECTGKLQWIFMAYCPAGTESSKNTMPCFKFVALLKDCGILNGIVGVSSQITVTEAELHFAKVLGALKEKCGDPRRDRLDFKAFYYLVCELASRIYPGLSVNRAFVETNRRNRVRSSTGRTIGAAIAGGTCGRALVPRILRQQLQDGL